MRVALAALAAALLVLAMLAVCAPLAHAAYNKAAPGKDYASSANKVTVKGSPIAAKDIPEGTYHITASTSTIMGTMTDVTLRVSAGAMTVNFTLTPSYTAVYPGKPDEAAVLAGEDGSEPSPDYIMGKLNSDGETRNYTMAISSLNAVLIYSAYNGNSKRNDGMWYGRNVCFNSTPEIDALVATSGGKDDEEEPKPSKPGDDGAGDSGGSGGGDSGGGAADDASGGADDGADDGGVSKPAKGDGAGGAAAGKADGAGGGTGGSNGAGKPQAAAGSDSGSKSPEPDEPKDEPAANKPAKPGKREEASTFSALEGPFTAIAYAQDAAADSDGSTKEAQTLDEKSVNYRHVLYGLLALLVALGFVLRVALYRRQRVK